MTDASRVVLYVRRRIKDSSYRLMQRLRNEGIRCFRVTPDTPTSNTGCYNGRMTVNPDSDDIIISYGCSTPPEWERPDYNLWVNSPGVVRLMSNKLQAFRTFNLHDIPCLDWTSDPGVAMSWNSRVFVRSKLTGRSGDGITVVTPGDELPDAPLYTRCFRGRNIREYRSLVWRGNIICTMQKRRRNGMGTDRGMPDLIRTHDNGWVYAVNDIQYPPDPAPATLALIADRLFGRARLGFAAVDYFADLETGEVRVCEVNTAPGLTSPTSLTSVANAITTYAQYF